MAIYINAQNIIHLNLFENYKLNVTATSSRDTMN